MKTVEDVYKAIVNTIPQMKFVATLGNFQANGFQFHAKLPEYI